MKKKIKTTKPKYFFGKGGEGGGGMGDMFGMFSGLLNSAVSKSASDIANEKNNPIYSFDPINQMSNNNSMIPYMALGGMMGNQAEVEGQEAYETPFGEAGMFSGPSHENGGIDTVVPKGTKIFSKRIKVDGKTMAKRKEEREAKQSKLENLLEKRATKLMKNNYKRTLQTNESEEQDDLQVQEDVKAFFAQEMNNGMFALGDDGYPDDPTFREWKKIWKTNPAYTDSEVNPTREMFKQFFPQEEGATTNKNSAMSGGDILGLSSNFFSGVAPLVNTISNRRGDTPNVNKFKDFGREGLAANKKAQSLAGKVKANKDQDIQLAANAAIKRNRNSARGVNTQRGLDLATFLGTNQAKRGTSNDYFNQLAGLLNAQSQLENQQDQVVMTGDQQKDLADRQDRDNFHTQFGGDLANMGNFMQKTASDLNKNQYNQDFLNLLSELSQYGLGIEYIDGKPTLKQVK